jgi:hypothetical protein
VKQTEPQKKAGPIQPAPDPSDASAGIRKRAEPRENSPAIARVAGGCLLLRMRNRVVT